jgi:hypothetical protein
MYNHMFNFTCAFLKYIMYNKNELIIGKICEKAVHNLG